MIEKLRFGGAPLGNMFAAVDEATGASARKFGRT